MYLIPSYTAAQADRHNCIESLSVTSALAVWPVATSQALDSDLSNGHHNNPVFLTKPG